MKTIVALIAAGGLMAFAQQASACPGKAHGPSDACPTGGGMIQQMDKDGDGAVSKQEFNAFHEERFKDMDSNKDGKVSSEEMGGMYKKGMHGQMKSMRHMSIEQHFDAADTNHDGALSKEEAEKGMPILFARFDENDANKDGKITKDEVMREPKRGPGMMRMNP
ncbi:MAG: EF-hand domain-containing protein [Gammaproteobacteria bacterium]|nr:EF-hand domain-containing protein [Gammaproteobacteria bacterium]MBU1625469.1 EF-hand domain-containing protein [Gammaproteobacteria bacterium]MBU1980729.1 EF-hand domain-containing protein [Gammaproteobacteria bacterium]